MHDFEKGDRLRRQPAVFPAGKIVLRVAAADERDLGRARRRLRRHHLRRLHHHHRRPRRRRRRRTTTLLKRDGQKTFFRIY